MKKIVIPLGIVSDMGEFGVVDLLRVNGFDTTKEISMVHEFNKALITYTQEGD